jgi:hypothetical protein
MTPATGGGLRNTPIGGSFDFGFNNMYFDGIKIIDFRRHWSGWKPVFVGFFDLIRTIG